MSPSRRTDSTAPPSTRSALDYSRRAFLAAGGTAALVSLAGCSSLVDFLGDVALEEVNIFNGADESVGGTIEVVDPNGDAVLEESFDLAKGANDDEEDANEDSTALYADVWTDDGDYEVSVELDENPAGESGNESEESGNESENVDETNLEDESGNESEESGNESDELDTESAENGTESEDNESENAEDDVLDADESAIGPSNTETVTIDDTDEQRLVVGIAQEGPAELISFHVIENLSDLQDEFE